MSEQTTFRSLLEEARKSPEYWVERAMLEFTEELIGLMESKKISRAELARRLGRNPAYMTKILRGSTNFTP
jgi:hypothetical protein